MAHAGLRAAQFPPNVLDTFFRENEAAKGRRVMSDMSDVLKQAVAEATRLPQSDQEAIGRQLLSHVEKLRRLRADIDAGIRSLDAGDGRELNIDEFIRDKTQRHGGA
jgi:hypothetical protein